MIKFVEIFNVNKEINSVWTATRNILLKNFKNNQSHWLFQSNRNKNFILTEETKR